MAPAAVGAVSSAPKSLEVTASVIRQEGFLSRTAARMAEGLQSTSAIVDMFFASRAMLNAETKKWLDGFNPTEADKAVAAAAIQWARSLPEESNDYLWRCYLTASGEFLTYKQFGIATALVQTHLREIGKAVEREARAKAGALSCHVGEVGQRQDFDVTVTDVFSRESDWGMTHPQDGHRRRQHLDLVRHRDSARAGVAYRISATVKKHDDFRGVQQTVVTRVTVLDRSRHCRSQGEGCQESGA